MASAAFTVNGSTPTGAVAVGASTTVTLALLSTSGVNSVAWSIVGNHNSAATDPTITPAGSPVGATASFPMPAGAGQAYLVQCVVNGGVDLNGDADAALTKRHIVGVNNGASRVPFCVGEELEREAVYGWTEVMNELSASATTGAVTPPVNPTDNGKLAQASGGDLTYLAGTATYQPLTWNGTTWLGAALNLAQAAAVTGVLAVANGGTGSARSLDAARTRIHCIGDSNTAGSNGTDTGHVGGWRSPCFAALREWRDDFDFVGTLADTLEGIASFGLPWSNGLAGQTIEGEAAIFAAQVATLGAAPDVIVDMLGTNDIGSQGQTAAQMFTDRGTLETAYTANAPNAIVVAIGVPPFVAGTTVGGNLAAWNATRVAYNTLLEAYCASTANHHYIDPDSLGAGDYQIDGVHLNIAGQAKLGRIVAEYLDRHVLNPLARGPRLTRTFRQRKVWPCVSSPGAGSISAGANAAYNPGSASFALAFDFYPTELPSAGFQSVATYDVYNGATGWFGIYQKDDALAVYWDNPAGTIGDTAGSANSKCLRVNAWHRVVLVAHRNGAASSVGLYVNGRLVGIATGLAAWAMSLHTFRLGNGPDFAGTPGYYGRCSAWQGSSVPQPGTMAALAAVEADYYLGESLVAGACSAAHQLAATLADEISGGAAMTLAGGAAAASAWPSGAPRRPWEYPEAATLSDGAAGTVLAGGGTGGASPTFTATPIVTTLTAGATAASGAVLSASALTYGADVVAPGIAQTICDAAGDTPQPLTFTPQPPHASASGTNRDPANCIVNLSAPTNGGTAEGALRVTRAGAFVAQLGPYPGAPTTYSGIWAGPSITPSATNFVMMGSSTGLYTYLNSPSTSGSLYLSFAGSASYGAVMSTTTWAWSETTAGPVYTQAIRTTDAAAPQNMILRAQSAWGSSVTGANYHGGHLLLQGGAEKGSAAGKKGGVRLQLNGTTETMLEATEVAIGQRVVVLCRGSDATTTQLPANTGDRVVYLADCATAPTGTPVGGGIISSQSGDIYWTDDAGVTSQLN